MSSKRWVLTVLNLLTADEMDISVKDIIAILLASTSVIIEIVSLKLVSHSELDRHLDSVTS